MTHTDLPLFRWEPPKMGVVIPFPLVKRVGKVRRVVEVLSERDGKRAETYWLQTIHSLRTQMERAGLPDDVIERELRAFADAVFGRMAYQHRRPDGGAA